MTAWTQLKGLLADYLVGWAYSLDPERFHDDDGKVNLKALAPVAVEARRKYRRP